MNIPPVQKKSAKIKNDKRKSNVGGFLRSHWRIIWYFVVVAALTVYIICKWTYAIDFTPFSDFNGNNLLFVVWIAFVSLPFLRIEFEKGKAGLDTGNNWDDKVDMAKSKNLEPPTSVDKDIDELEAKIIEAKRGAMK